MDNLKVLLIANCPRNLSAIKGGVESVSINLLNGFIDTPVKIKVISIREDILTDEVVKFSENIDIYYFKFTFKGSKTFEYFTYGNQKVKKVYNEFNPDIVHLQGTGPIMQLLSGIDKNKIVITQHGILSEELKYQIGFKQKFKFFLRYTFEKYILPKYSNYISISEYNYKILTSKYAIKNLNTRVIYNPVNPLFFKMDYPVNLNRIIYIGVINKRKGLLNLVKALALLKSEGITFYLDVAGGNNEREYLQEINQVVADNQLQPYINFHGWVTQTQVSELLAQSSILVLPSQQESLPVCIAEAMAASRVVVATNTGGVSEMFTNSQSGFLIAKDNIYEIVDSLRMLYNNKDIISSVSKNARNEAIAKYNPQTVANQTIDYYNSILKRIK